MSEDIYNWEGKEFPEMEETLKCIQKKMMQYQKQTDYASAEAFRIKYQNCKEALQNKNLTNTKIRHQKELNDLAKAKQEEMFHFNEYWDNKMNQFNDQSKRILRQLDSKHKKEVMAMRMQLQEQLPQKVKESNQLLNLRKMEEQAAKQKNYIEAHRIQQKVNEVYSQERDSWMEGRTNKIQTSVKNLNTKQQAEILNFNRKVQDSYEDLSKDRHLQDQGINQKYQNVLKELRANHQRQILSIFGQLRNLGGKSPVKKPKVICN